jgi:hypothetical protein
LAIATDLGSAIFAGCAAKAIGECIINNVAKTFHEEQQVRVYFISIPIKKNTELDISSSGGRTAQCIRIPMASPPA